MRLLLALALLCPAFAQAIELTVSWPAVAQYVDDNDLSTDDTMRGKVTYEVWGGIPNAAPRLLVTTDQTSVVRDVNPAIHCYHVVTVHESPEAGIERAAPSSRTCFDARPPEPTPRLSGVPQSTEAPTVVPVQ